jgi:hypothetical protein
MSKGSFPSESFSRAPIYRVLAFGAVCLLLPALFLAYQLRTPSDGSRFSKAPNSVTEEGIYIHPMQSDSDLQEGDLVVGIEGRSLESWAEQSKFFQGRNAVWIKGEQVTYQVIRNGERLDTPVTLSGQPVRSIISENWGVLIYTVILQLVATFVIARRSHDPAARALFIWAFTSSHFYLWSFYLQYYDLVNGYGYWFYQLPATFLWLASWSAAFHLALVFPAPLPLVQRKPRLIRFAYLSTFVIFFLWVGISRLVVSNALMRIMMWWRGEFVAAIIIFFPAMITMIAQYTRFRQGSEHAKIKWVVYSAVICGSLTVFFYLIPEYLDLPSLGVNLIGVLLLPFPAAIALAIWRYRLFDIDLIIHRTLVYSVLTLTLGFIYFTSIALIGQLFTRVTGGEGRSTLAIVLTTLLVAALFNPLRQRIQKTIDRRFFRQKYDSTRILEEYSVRLQDEFDLDELQSHLLSVVEDTLKPEHVSLWLKPTPGKKQ